jgi:radial spoke head protein 4A
MTEATPVPVAAQAAAKPVPVAAQAAAKHQRVRELREIDFSHLRRELEGVMSTSGTTLYSHLKRVFEHLILQSPDLALDRFEEISYMIKQGMDPNEFIKCLDIRNY